MSVGFTRICQTFIHSAFGANGQKQNLNSVSRERQTDRQAGRQTPRPTDCEGEREGDRETQTDRQTDRQTNRENERILLLPRVML